MGLGAWKTNCPLQFNSQWVGNHIVDDIVWKDWLYDGGDVGMDGNDTRWRWGRGGD